MSKKKPRRVFLTTVETANLLGVSSQTVLNWIEQESIPFVRLPSGSSKRREFRIPLRGLLESLSGNYDMNKALDEMMAEMGLEFDADE